MNSKSGFTLLEVLSASAVVTIVSYLIITQIISLQMKISRYTQLPQVGNFVNNAIGEAVPIEVNFNKGNLGSYANNDYSWQIKREVVEICSRYFSTQDAKKECYLDMYTLTVDVAGTVNNEENIKKEIYFLKTIEDEKESTSPDNR